MDRETLASPADCRGRVVAGGTRRRDRHSPHPGSRGGGCVWGGSAASGACLLGVQEAGEEVAATLLAFDGTQGGEVVVALARVGQESLEVIGHGVHGCDGWWRGCFGRVCER